MSTQQTIPAFIEQVINNIQYGMLDHTLDHLINVIRDRQKVLAPKCLGIDITAIHVGDSVKFNHKARPAYLIGATATVKKVNRQRVKVVLNNPQGRFGSKLINTPVSILNFA